MQFSPSTRSPTAPTAVSCTHSRGALCAPKTCILVTRGKTTNAGHRSRLDSVGSRRDLQSQGSLAFLPLTRPRTGRDGPNHKERRSKPALRHFPPTPRPDNRHGDLVAASRAQAGCPAQAFAYFHASGLPACCLPATVVTDAPDSMGCALLRKYSCGAAERRAATLAAHVQQDWIVVELRRPRGVFGRLDIPGPH